MKKNRILFKNKKWITHLALSNIKRHRKRNIFSILSLVVGLTASFLIFGFSLNAENSIREECYKQFDYGVLTITKESKTESTNGGLSIVRNSRPSTDEIYSLEKELSLFEIDINLDAIISPYLEIKYGKDELKEYSYNPIYSFQGNYINKQLLLMGDIPVDNSIDFCVINEKAYKDFVSQYKTSPIGKTFSIKSECEYPYYTGDDYQPVINDFFVFNKKITITGVVKDLNFLSTPKIYYSHVGMSDYLSYYLLNDLSTYLGKDVSWIDRISKANNSETISSYSYRLFLKDIKRSIELGELINNFKSPYCLSSNSQTRSNALISLIKAATTGMELFLVIALLGTTLIMGIVSFSFYSEDRKTIAILACIGGKMDDINDIYCLENIMIGVLAFIFSIVISPLLQMLINMLVEKFTGFSDIIQIPIMSFLEIPFGFLIIVMMATLFISAVSSLLPIAFSKKISLKEELKDE